MPRPTLPTLGPGPESPVRVARPKPLSFERPGRARGGRANCDDDNDADDRRRGGRAKRANGGYAGGGRPKGGPGSDDDSFDDATRAFDIHHQRMRDQLDKPLSQYDSDRAAMEGQAEDIALDREKRMTNTGSRPTYPLNQPEGYPAPRRSGGRLSAAQRQSLPRSDFALPGRGSGPKGAGSGSYPIPDRSHAANALARSANKSPAVRSAVRAKVRAKFPGMGKH